MSEQLDTKKQILDALEAKYGIVTDACRSIGLSRSTFYDWLKNDHAFKSAVEEIQETAIDYVEGKLFERINGVEVQTDVTDDGTPITYKQPPSDAAVIFYLKCKGKKRGYVERTEITGADGGPLEVITGMQFKPTSPTSTEPDTPHSDT